MFFVFTDNGFRCDLIDQPTYEPKEGEVVSEGRWLTEAELLIAFPGRAAAIEAQRIFVIGQEVRKERNDRMRLIYDAGTQMVRRELESTSDAVHTAKLNLKLDELHSYARLLQAIPEQPGFPDVVTWPIPPTDELE